MTEIQPSPCMVVRLENPMPGGARATVHELRFARLSNPRQGYAFPCDAQGKVDLARLSEQGRANHAYARATVGREFLAPVIHHCRPCGDTVIIDSAG